MSSSARTSTDKVTSESGCPRHKLGMNSSMNPHAFHPPTEGDIRGPCPALNALANHGYLPRSGRDITPQDLLTALQHPNTYRISAPLSWVLVYGGLFLIGNLGFKIKPITLHELARHNCIEHDASVVHLNTNPGHKFAPIETNQVLLKDFLKPDSIAIEHVVQRRVELEDASPLDALHQEIARGEWALVLDIFGKKSKEKIATRFLQTWLKDNRFSEGWMPTHQQTLFATVRRSSDIRRRMNEFRKEYLKTPEEKREKGKLSRELSEKYKCANGEPHKCH
ncbi:Cloroperoxidase [Hysterangium stoloniferum]|nr:Cloroperoxidase [Hysterangium stoloniferum]